MENNNKATFEQVYTLNEFLVAYKLTKYLFYKLVENNMAPKIMRLGKRIYVSKEAALEWQHEIENLSKK